MTPYIIGLFVMNQEKADSAVKPKVDQAFAYCLRASCSDFWEWRLETVEGDQRMVHRFAYGNAARFQAERLRGEGVKAEVKYLGKDRR